MEEADANVSQMPVVVAVRMTIHSFSKTFATDGKEEAGEQNEKGPVERSVPGAAGKATALLQDCERIQRGEWVRARQVIAQIKCSFSSPQDAPLKTRAGGWQELSSVNDALAMKAGELEFGPRTHRGGKKKKQVWNPLINPVLGRRRQENSRACWPVSLAYPMSFRPGSPISEK